MKIQNTTLAIVLLLLLGCSKQGAVKQADSTVVTKDSAVSNGASGATAAERNASNFDAHKVSAHNLPDSVRPFVARHYPEYQIVSATYDPLCGGKPAIDVSIRAKGKPEYSLIFLPSGAYVQKEQDVPLASAPHAVLATVKGRYSGYHVDKQIERLELADGSINYSFDLSKAKRTKELILSAAGAVVCEGGE